MQGKGAIETQEIIREELNQPNAQISAIGLAGESRCFTASIEQGRGSCSRLGAGAVMGDKNIKAIAVRGTKDVFLARGAEFIKLVEEMREFVQLRNEDPIEIAVHTPQHGAIVGSPQAMKYTDEEWHTSAFAWGNARGRRRDFWTKEIEESWDKSQTSAVKRLIGCFEYGLDSFSTPQILAFAVELYEAGILTDADFEGCPTDKEGKFFWLLDRVARREGIGDILADGTYWAARKIGKGAEAFDHKAADPAGIRGLATSAEAFKKIAESQQLFVSRGDDSGTHKKELAIWKKSGIEVGGNWYQETGSGMGQTINIASEKDGYTLTDRATYLALKENLHVEILVEGEPDLLNIYHVAQVNPEKSELINAQGAKDFVEFMVSEKAQQIIGEFGVDKFGSPLFFPDAHKDPKEYGLKY